MKIALTNLSNSLYNASRFCLNESAKRFNITEIYSYNFDEIKGTSFFKENEAILSLEKGIGYWLWKPFIILETFKSLDEGDIVIYSDCGIEIITDLSPLINIAIKRGIVLFTNSKYTNKIWTKRDCFVLMDCDTVDFWDGAHCDAAFSLFRKDKLTEDFLKEWLLYGSNSNIITDLPNICGKPNFPEFIDHRWDQSILSLLAIKYKVELFRMPTQFGNHYKLQKFRVANEFNCLNQGEQKQLYTYSNDPIENSHYFQLLDHHRKKTATDHKLMASKKKTKPAAKLRLKSLIKKVLTRAGVITLPPVPPHVNYQKLSFSQCGEDLLIQYVFTLRGVHKPTYLDIGANHPYSISNTALFYKTGCRGINIDANPLLIAEFEKERPDDINLNVGISSEAGELDFYIMEDDTLSTFLKQEYEHMTSTGKKLRAVEKVKLTTIADILNTYNKGLFPDFLSLDVEGFDFAILQSIKFEKHSPKVICVEAAEYSSIGAGQRRAELIDFLVSKNYYEYANTNLNAIMVRKDFWFI